MVGHKNEAIRINFYFFGKGPDGVDFSHCNN